MSYSLALSSTMMSCTVHSPTDSLAQPTCILVYIECNPAPGDSPFKLSLGVHSNSWVLFLPSSQSLLVWWFVLGLPWVTSDNPMRSSQLLIALEIPLQVLQHEMLMFQQALCRYFLLWLNFNTFGSAPAPPKVQCLEWDFVPFFEVFQGISVECFPSLEPFKFPG